jgi:molecular chaperone GrpE
MNPSPAPDATCEPAAAPPPAPDATCEPAAAPPPDRDAESEALRAESEKFRDLYLRSQADLENYRKRAAREREDATRYANASLIEKLLPILDNFELGLDAARQSADAGGILAGMSMVQRQLHDFLREIGVEVIDAQGAAFDPNLHEAIGHESSGEAPEGAIIRQMRKGYRLRDRLLRAAAVIVSKGPAAK